MTDYWTLTETYTGKGIRLYYPQNHSVSTIKPCTIMTAPNQTYTDNIALQFEGMTRSVNITVIVFDDDTDKSTGGDDIVTINEQLDYLENTILRQYGGSGWQLDGGPYSDTNIVLETIKYNREAEYPTVVFVELSFQMGTGI